ncbi:MAG: translocation/assembly module TamB domain-containing protein [Terriglobia bacterium]
MSRRISWPVRILIIIFIIVVGVYAAARVVISSRWFHQEIEAYVLQTVQSVTGARPELAGLVIQPFSFKLILRGLTLHGTESSSQPPLLYAQTIVLRISPWTLVRRRLLLSRFFGSGLSVHLFTYADGSTNLPGPAGGKAANGSLASELMKLSLKTAVLESANLYWNNRKIPIDLAAKNVALLLYYAQSHDYWGSFSSSSLRLNVRGRTLPSLALATHLDFSTQGLALNHLVWRSEGVQGSGEARLAWQPATHGLIQLQAHGELRPLARLMGASSIREGRFTASVQAGYSGNHLGAHGNVQVRDLQVRSASLAPPGKIDVAASFTASPDHVSLTHVQVAALGGVATGEAHADLRGKTPRFAASLDLRGVRLAEVFASAPMGQKLQHLLPLAALAQGKADASWRGSFQDLKSSFDLVLSPPEVVPAGSLPVNGFIRGTAENSPALAVELTQAELSTAHSKLSAQGALGAGQTGLHVRYTTTDFSEADPILEDVADLSKPIPVQLKSPAVFTATISGSISQPEIQGQLRVGAFTYAGWSWSSFAAGLSVSASHLGISSGQLRSESSAFDFSGAVALTNWKVTPSSELSVTAQASRSPLRGLEDAFGLRYPVTGVASGRVSLTGTPARLAGSGSFEITDGKIEGEPVDLVSGQVHIDNSVFSFENLLLRKGTGRLSGSASFDLPLRSFALQLHGSDFSLAQIERIQPQPELPGEPLSEARLQGVADFDLKGSGTLSQPRFESTLSVRGLEAEGDRFGDLQAVLALQKQQLQATASFRGPAGAFDLKLAAGIRGEWPAQLSGNFTGFHLDPWIDWIEHSHLQVHPTATGTFTGSGPLKNLSQFSFSAEARTLSIDVPDFRLANVQPVEIRYQHETLQSNRVEMTGPSTNVAVQLRASLRPPSAFSLDVEGKSNASVLELLDPSLRAAGNFTINVNVHATGSLRQPSISGQIGVESVSLRYGSELPAIAPVSGTIVLKGNRATIQSLQGESGQSSVRLTGYVTLGGTPRFDLGAAMAHIRMEFPSDFISILSGDLHLAGSTAGGELTGDVTLDSMYASPDFNLVSWLGQAGPSLEAAPVSGTPGIASNIRLNVHVSTNPDVRVTSRTLTFTATIDTTLRGTLANPVATGGIHFQNGQALIAGNRYQITHGDISLTSPFQTTPVLDIEAQTRVERYDLAVEVTGPFDQAKLSYRSDPPLPTEDILSLLALGYAPQQAMMRASGNEPFGAVGASALLSQALSSQVSGRVQRLFGVSRIRIDPNLLGPSTAGGARVTIEEQVSPDLTITYSTNTAAAQQRDIRVRWDISNKISLIGERDINGVYGFEVRFHRRMR